MDYVVFYREYIVSYITNYMVFSWITMDFKGCLPCWMIEFTLQPPKKVS